MFGRMMNNYYYGKSGKGDFKKDDLPNNRWQLFMDTLKTRLSGLCRLNLMYMIIWLPTMIVLFMYAINAYNGMSTYLSAEENNGVAIVEQTVKGEDGQEQIVKQEIPVSGTLYDYLYALTFNMLLILIPCIAITGPATAGVSYITRNWSRDEHAFIWSDFKDAVKLNWKQSLVVSFITGLVPFVVFMCWQFYGQMANDQPLMIIPQVLILMLGIVWCLSVTYLHPLIVSYELKLKDLFRNGLLLGVARLPFSIGIRLLHCVPFLIGLVVALFWNYMYGMMFLFVWYFLIGFTLSRFITASYTNSVFDRYINSKIEGATVNRGLRAEDDDDDDIEDGAEE